MALKKINPTKTKAWQKLLLHFNEIKELHLKDLFKNNPNRASDLSIDFKEFHIDYSKNNITQETLELLIELANEVDLNDAIQKYFSGDLINTTENRAVMHTALRNSKKTATPFTEGIYKEINSALQQIAAFSQKITSGEWKGYTGKPITDIVNIGIGGSDLGPKMVVTALRHYKNHLNTHFVSNIDGDHVSEIIKKLNPETTLFVIVSKTFTTQETLTNANTIKEWFLKSATEKNIEKHFVAVSTNLDAIEKFGIDKNNVFPMWTWVGGRFALRSAVGLSISLSVGFKNFKSLSTFSKISIVYLPLFLIKNLSISIIFFPTPSGSTIGVNSPLDIRSSSGPFNLISNVVGFITSSNVKTIESLIIGCGNIG